MLICSKYEPFSYWFVHLQILYFNKSKKLHQKKTLTPQSYADTDAFLWIFQSFAKFFVEHLLTAASKTVVTEDKLREKCPNTAFFGSYVPVFRLNTGLQSLMKGIRKLLWISEQYFELNCYFASSLKFNRKPY